MQVIKTVPALRQALKQARQAGQSIGFVPTMGCLHAGHLALVQQAHQDHECVVVSIFVNPTQFGPQEDFARYPRTFESDCNQCEASGAAIVFAPTTEDFYAPQSSTWVEETFVTQGLCGTFRPGHFRGVTTVVAMLFNVVQPDTAYFGRKDLQQLGAIRRMVRDLHFPIKIVAHETIRESNGVAMSSRNRYLSPTELQQATAIPEALQAAQNAVQQGERQAQQVQQLALHRLQQEPALQLQYCEVVDADTLKPVEIITPGSTAVAIACYLGKTRLIDNCLL
jgi:pantoate--beta-alanine ligase